MAVLANTLDYAYLVLVDANYRFPVFAELFFV